MFTGIIESTGKVVGISKEGSNIRFSIESLFTQELKVDQSVAHNGVCLTVTSINEKIYEVVAIEETLLRSNFFDLKTGDVVNLERSLKLNDRLDGHIVQGHVDQVAKVEKIEKLDGSWRFHFIYEPSQYTTVEKGSVCVNGVSLTVVDSGKNYFSVAIIPYTWEHTNFKNLKTGDAVNVEFDIVGKYVLKQFVNSLIR